PPTQVPSLRNFSLQTHPNPPTMSKTVTLRSRIRAACALTALARLLPRPATAQLNVDAFMSPYVIPFDATLAVVNNGALTGAGFAPAPTGGQLNSNAWAVTGMSDGALNFGNSVSTGDHARGQNSDPGGVSTGGIYAFSAPNIGSTSL